MAVLDTVPSSSRVRLSASAPATSTVWSAAAASPAKAIWTVMVAPARSGQVMVNPKGSPTVTVVLSKVISHGNSPGPYSSAAAAVAGARTAAAVMAMALMRRRSIAQSLRS